MFWKCQELKAFWNNKFVLLSSILKKKLDCLVINGEVDLKKKMALIFMTAAKTCSLYQTFGKQQLNKNKAGMSYCHLSSKKKQNLKRQPDKFVKIW